MPQEHSTEGTNASNGCPVMHNGRNGSAKQSTRMPATNRRWWPSSLDIDILDQNAQSVDPWNGEFDYSSAFKQVDYEALKADIEAVMTLDRFDLR